MERQNPRSSAKSCSSSESKGKQDVTNKHLRQPRFKDSVSPRPDARKKPNPQRNQEHCDKRPRNRSGHVCERYRSEITEDSVEEAFAKHGSKKINLNHLLNFTLAPVEHRDVGRRPAFHRAKHPKYNKELFLQANCQFVARNTGNFAVHQKNPDLLVEWTLIEEISLPSYEVPLCPICLYSPIAAKITRCGHIYCWPCILHYLSLTDRTWQKCPICFEAVHKNELKSESCDNTGKGFFEGCFRTGRFKKQSQMASVSLKIQKSFAIGDEITMCLMKRAKGSLLTAPVVYESPKQLCNLDDDNNVTRFQKLLLASTKDVEKIIARERNQLEKAYAEEKDTPEACFIESALKLLEERENAMFAQSPVGDSTLMRQLQSSNDDKVYQKLRLDSVSSTDSQEENVNLITNGSKPDSLSAAGIDESNQEMKFPESRKNEFSYFYQAEDGQHIFLHHLNIRMLVKEFGSLENAPPKINAKIVEIESVSMNEILRKRLRYLQHLPMTCEFQIVELNFSNLLMKSTLLQFQSDINKRKQMRNRKAQFERRREKFIEQEVNKKFGKFPKATYNLNSISQFPSCEPNLSPPQCSNVIDSAAENFDSDPYLDGTSPTPTFGSPSNDAEGCPTTSFAQMLNDGLRSFDQTLKYKKAVNNEKPLVHDKEKQDAGSDDDSWVPPPEYHQSFSDAIQAALETVSLEETPETGKKSGRKKKGKKLLFTTSMCRNK